MLFTSLLNRWRELYQSLEQHHLSPVGHGRPQPLQMAEGPGRSILGIRLSPANCPVRKSKAQKLAEREQELLNMAEDLINAEGFAGFTMDKLAAVSGYSKGTMYNHFSSKEDCLAALCLRGMGLMEGLFTRAIAFDGKPREKILALNFAYQLYSQLQPTLSLAVLTARTPAFAEKTSAERSVIMMETDRRITLRVDDVFRAAIAAGDLPAQQDLPVPALSFMCWAQAFGSTALLGTARDLTAVSRIAQLNMPLISASVMLDGLGFRPLSTEWDYRASWERIGRECFSAELALLSPGAAD